MGKLLAGGLVVPDRFCSTFEVGRARESRWATLFNKYEEEATGRGFSCELFPRVERSCDECGESLNEMLPE